jgi:amino acid adenylation domain-containing protein
MGLLMAELAGHYGRLRAGQPAAAEQPPLQYPDYAVWQRDQLGSAAMAEHLSYWEQQLAGLPTFDLPFARPRPPVPSFRGDTLTFDVDQRSYAAIGQLAAEHGASPFMVLLAAFAGLLARLSNAEEVVLGNVVAGRTRPELEQVVGFFANMCVLRLAAAGDPTFAELLNRAREVCLGAWEHQEAPFEKVVERLVTERDASRNPLFQVAIQMLNQSIVSGPALPGLDSRPADLRLARSRFDMTVSMVDHGDRFSVIAEFSTDLFSEQLMRRLLTWFDRLLSAAVRAPQAPLSELSYLSETELRQAADLGRGESAGYDPGPLHAMVAAAAERSPDAVAVRHNGTELTYRALQDSAGRLALWLQRAGVRPGDMVAVITGRGLEEIKAQLALWRLGAVYVPLDPEAPPARLRRMLSGISARLALTIRRYRDHVPAGDGLTVLELADQWSELPASGPEPAQGEASPLAYVLHTSGTTGVPKAVALRHDGIANYLSWMVQRWKPQPGDHVLHGCAPFFDLGAAEVLSALSTGATLVIADKEQLLSPGGLTEILRDEAITHVFLTPTTLGLAAPAEYPRLREILVAGEVCTSELVHRWSAPGREVRNAYGPTEASVSVTAMDCTGWTGPGHPPIGYAMPNRQIWVLDRWGQPTPAGIPGEIAVGGDGVSPGYLNDPALTARKFTPAPLGLPGTVYHTGDVGYWGEDGALRYLGRADRQVKLRGLRIELEEIEAALVRHPRVDQAAVLTHTGPSGAAELVAYLVGDPGVVTSVHFREHLAAELPAYMIPARYVLLPELPTTPSGKLNRSALPSPAGAERAADQAFTAPRTPAERQVAEAFAALLGIDRIGAQDDFFRLGGHSLQAAALLARLASMTGVRIPMEDFYVHATVESAARWIGSASVTAQQRSPLVTLRRGGSRPALYCPHAVSGSPYWYMNLVKTLPADQPIHAFEAPGLEGDEEPIADIRTLAARYVAAMRAHQPDGPYLLAGWSMGGFLSFEMARQLHAAGAAPALVLMIDSNAPGPLPAPPEQQIMQLFVDDLAGVSGQPASPLPAGILAAEEPLEALITEVMARKLIPSDLDRKFISDRYRVFRANTRAVYAYQPSFYAGNILMIQASQEAPRDPWRRFAQDYQQLTIPGNHYTIWSEQLIPALAAVIKQQIRDAGVTGALA